MEFGKLTAEEVRVVDFGLPADGVQTALTLSAHTKRVLPLYYVGCAKWGRKEWKGLIYPEATKDANFLGEYVQQFNSIELNAVFYRIPKAEQVLKWRKLVAANTDHNFLFFPKFSRSITHMKKLISAEHLTDQYLKSIAEFGPYLGPCFLQLSDNFGPDRLEVLENFLRMLPADLKVFVEVRHQDWFAKGVKEKLFSLLSELGKGAVITDASGRRDSLHMELPTPEAFIRFVGNGFEFFEADKARIDAWIVRIKQWLDAGLQQVYFFLHQPDEADTPLIADYTIKAFNKSLGSKLPELKFIKN